jgi:ElaB/YqjD/DUF883 family membrane-anchored ribosome-binding protein
MGETQGGVQESEAPWPWIVRNPWLRNAFRDRKSEQPMSRFEDFASDVQAVIHDLRDISDADIERVRARLEQGLAGSPARSTADTATMIGMAIGFVLARRRQV